MAEAVVSVALETFRDLLQEEARFLIGVGDQVKELETQLKEMRCLLEDADARRHDNKTVANWISQIRDLTYRAEDAIEMHASRVYLRRRGGLRQLVGRYSCILRECYSLHQIGSEISQIHSQLGRVTESMRAYGIQSIIGPDRPVSSATKDNQNWSRKTFPDFQIDECFVGMEDELKRLDFLLAEDKQHLVISVWGMGGLGKTTIAKKVYNHIKRTKNGGFDSFAWVCISQECQIRSVLEDILSQLTSNEETPNLSDTALIEQLCKIQREKRCLIVLDDLWKISHWDDGFSHAFHVQGLQSKILVTTRELKVAEIGFPVQLKFLSLDESWELLKRKAFPDDSNIPDFAFEENLERLGKEMVGKCGNLPLAISLLGGVLRKKKSVMEWELVNGKINAVIYRDEKEIDGVLNLSYESLPYYLKPCFLYMGLFKEDKIIGVEGLYKMWIAHGMISFENIRDSEESLMDIAELYLNELASRSVVQVVVGSGVSPKRKYHSCKLHDVIRELCLKMGRKEHFGVQRLDYQGGKFSTLLGEAFSHVKIRHLAIFLQKEVESEHGELRMASGEDTSKHLRSLKFYNRVKNDVEFPPQSIVDFHKFKLLRELVMEGFKFAGRKLPRGITSLVHLRCLRLQRCELDELPPSIGNFVYLDTLELRYSRNVRVPNVFRKMPRLKRLFLPNYGEEITGNYRLRLDEEVEQLEMLEGLDSRVHELKCMDKMKNLRYFSEEIHDNESLLAIMNAIATKWNKLVYSRVVIKQGCVLRGGEECLKKAFTCPNLRVLWIHAKLGKMLLECGSDFISSNVASLNLDGCEIEDDPMGMLGKLPCLKHLYLLSSSFVGEEMTCPSNSFPRLKKLIISGLPKLREWRVEAGAMPLLSDLEITFCPRLEMLPDGLSAISTLQKLKISRTPELKKRVSPSGEDFHKVRHVPSIFIGD